MPEIILITTEYRDQVSRNFNQASNPSKVLYTDSLEPKESTHKQFLILKTEGESEADFKNIKTSPDTVDKISMNYK